MLSASSMLKNLFHLKEVHEIMSWIFWFFGFGGVCGDGGGSGGDDDCDVGWVQKGKRIPVISMSKPAMGSKS